MGKIDREREREHDRAVRSDEIKWIGMEVA